MPASHYRREEWDQVRDNKQTWRTELTFFIKATLYNVLIESVIAVIVLAITTLLTKMFKSQEDGHIMGPGDTNYCSSSECLRCSRDYGDDSDEAATEVLIGLKCRSM